MNTMRIGKFAGSMAVASALLLSGAGLVSAQTYTTGSVTPATATGTNATGTTPGVPNTGAGGDVATNLALLGASAVIVVGGAAYLARKKYSLS
jgi:hypothetical protein